MVWKNSMHRFYIQEQKNMECRKDVWYREVLCCIRALWVQLGVSWGLQRCRGDLWVQ